MIRLTDFIKTPDIERTKIKFNMNAADTSKKAWDFLLDFEPDEYQKNMELDNWITINAWKKVQTNNNLNAADYLIALAQYYPYGPEFYVFGGLYKVEKILPEVYDSVGYKLTLMDEYKEYIKRLIIKIDKSIGRDVYNRRYATVQEQLNPEVYEIAPNIKLGHFPGYQNVSMSHKDLYHILLRNEPSWKQALMHVKGIYVITDKNTGKLYVGSASGNTEGIWQRWSGYTALNNLTGGNKEFINILNEKGEAYIRQYFQYSILEIFDTKTKQEYIIERENYWKRVLVTREHGMNAN